MSTSIVPAVKFIHPVIKAVSVLPESKNRCEVESSRDASRTESHDIRCLFITPSKRMISYESRFWYFEEFIAQIKIQKLQCMPICTDVGQSLCIIPDPKRYAPIETRVISFMLARLIMQQFNLVMTAPLWCKFDNLTQSDNATQHAIISSSCDINTLRILGAESLSVIRIEFIDKFVQKAYPTIAYHIAQQLDSAPTVILQRNDCGVYTRFAAQTAPNTDDDLTPFRIGKLACVPIVIMAKMVYCAFAGSNTHQWAPIVIAGNIIIVCFNLDEMTLSCINNAALMRAAYFGNTCIKYVFAIDYGSDRYGIYITRFLM